LELKDNVMTERIYLSGNDLIGTVPSELTRLTNLGMDKPYSYHV
jgi:hypothetical protein